MKRLEPPGLECEAECLATNGGDGTNPTPCSAVRLLPWLIILTYGIFGASVIFRNPVQIGGDEGMEFSKAMIVAHDSWAIPKVWNDQPWFYSWVFGMAFRIFGFQPVLPRIFSLLCVCLFCAFLPRMMPRKSGPTHHLLAVVFFLTYRSVLTLSLSAMCELPATLLGLLGTAVLFQDNLRRPRTALVAGGLVMGVAMAIKLTAGMIFLAGTIAMIAKIVCDKSASLRERCRINAGRYAFWITGWLVAILAVFWISPRSSPEMLWGTHARAARHIPEYLVEMFTFGPSILLRNPLPLGGFLIGGMMLVGRRSSFGPGLLPISYAGVALLTHSFHRPFYDYYNLHFAASFAPIAGWAVGTLATIVPYPKILNNGRLFFRAGYVLEAGAALFAALLLGALCGGKSSAGELQRISAAELADRDSTVALLHSMAVHAHWAFAFGQHSCAVAQGGLIIVPELAILSQKREWAGDVKGKDILRIVKNYRPDVLLLPAVEPTIMDDVARPWAAFVSSFYSEALRTKQYEVFLLNDAAKKKAGWPSPAK
jgi:Dolichyl-phosphate-mannose-protein mannosyltransferase